MKKNFYFFAASLFIAFCSACSQDDGEVYNLDGRVYFYEQKAGKRLCGGNIEKLFFCIAKFGIDGRHPSDKSPAYGICRRL